MSVNYAAVNSRQIDEAFAQESITEHAVNKDYDFTGAKTVKVHSFPTASMNNYNRSGSGRYGTPDELSDNVQEMTLSQDRAFTFTVDAGNQADNGAYNAAKALRRQIDEVIVPEVDKYRLSKMAAGAGNSRYGAFTGNGATGAYEHLLDLGGDMDADLVPSKGRIAFVTSAFYKALKLDDNFIKAGDIAQNLLITGQIGEVDGVAIVKDAARLPEGIACMVVHPEATTAPHKLDEYRVHENPPGISGNLVEGRNYYDAFVLDKKKNAIAVLRSALLSLTVTNAAGASGKTKFTAVSGHASAQGVSYGTLVYVIASSPSAPALGDDLSNTTSYPELTLNTDISATSGHEYIVALKDQDGKCIGVSAAATVTVGA